MSPDSRKPVVPTAEAWNRVRSVVRRVEGSFSNVPARKGEGFGAWSTPAFVAKCTTSITARSGATYGTGSAKLQSDSGTAYVDDGDVVAVKNNLNKTIASGAYITVVWALGQWRVVAVGDCANLS